MPRSPTSAPFRALAVAAAAFYAAFIVRTAFSLDGQLYFPLFDDAMISMRYARNLAEGYGLVWNPGEAPVEGYTNFLWTLWMALVHLTGISDAKAALPIMLSSVACLLATASVIRAIAARVANGDRWAVFASVALTLFSYPVNYWGLRGMEVALLALFVSLGVLSCLRLNQRANARDRAVLCATIVLMVLTRTDAVIPAAVLIVFAGLGATSERARTLVVLAATLLVTLAGHTAFRLVYYDDVLPNTYYLKATGTPLGTRLGEGTLVFVRTLILSLWPLCLGLPVLLLHKRKQLETSPLGSLDRKLLLTLFAGQVAYSTYVGGDAFEQLHIANRYISIVLPLAFVLAATWIRELLNAGKPGVRMLAGSLALGGGVALVIVLAVWRIAPELLDMYGMRPVGFALVDALLAATGVALLLKEFAFRHVLAFAALLLGLNGSAYVSWVVENATYVDFDSEMTELGLAIRNATTPKARVAVVAAGASPYHSHRSSVDLLGKSDKHVARVAPRGPFKPGHNKWDYRASVGTFAPDVILQTWFLSREDKAYLTQSGYVRLPNGILIKKSSREVLPSIATIRFHMLHPHEDEAY